MACFTGPAAHAQPEGPVPQSEPAAAVPEAVAPPPKGRPLGQTRSKPVAGASSGNERKAEPSGMLGNTGVRTALSLGMVLSLILGLAAAVKKFGGGKAMGALGGGAPAGIMEVLGRYPIGRGCTLVLLKVDRRILLLSQSTPALRIKGASGGLATLCEITEPEEVASILIKSQDASGESMGERFRGLLTRFDARHEDAVEPDVVDLRKVRVSAAGDRAELWDETREVDSPRGFPSALVVREDAVGSLRRRLEGLRTGVEGGEV